MTVTFENVCLLAYETSSYMEYFPRQSYSVPRPLAPAYLPAGGAEDGGKINNGAF